jgi:ribonuclease HII
MAQFRRIFWDDFGMSRVEELSIEDIRKRYLDKDEPVSAQILTRLQKDRREGVKKLHAVLKKRFEKQRDERLRMDAMRYFEKLLWKSGIQDIAGVDEAGMAPLAGPVVAASVMFPPDTEINGINDSKQLDAPTREELAKEIRAKASGVAVGIVSVEEIDAVNIYHAGLLAMRRAVEGMPRPPQHVLVDARTIPGVPMPQNAFNKGDGINFSIAAASIIAKTTRDAMMDELDRRYPGYGLASHKGYPTPEHKAAIVKLGVCEIHRMSFPALHELQGEFSAVFYTLRTQLFEAGTRDALSEWEAAFKRQREALEEREANKLKLLISRRWKLIA